MLRRLLSLLFLSGLATLASAQTPRADASAAIPKPARSFMEKHESFLARAQAGPIGLLFLGDSITEQWKTAPAVWEKHYGTHQPANFGIGGDQTQNVIWRIEHGELDGIAPRAVVLLIGTNNSASHSAPEIVAAIGKILGLVRAKLPETKILLNAIFPRGPRKNKAGEDEDWQARMAVIREVNAALPGLADGQHVHFLDAGPRFLDAEGKIPTTIMRDQLHLTPEGYRIWAEAMQPKLDELLK
ncbi:MAG: GDSL-type esterase/lipase family protein [Candidatus Didemnitutus sp.]|nr:GDSL-type esterase/lipase family protein [Candidatus Didemnitutus sp.]